MGDLSPREEFAAASADGEAAALVTRLDPALPAGRRHLLVRPDGATTGSSGDPGLDRDLAAAGLAALATGRAVRASAADQDVFVDVVAPPPRLLLFGAVPVADAVSRYATSLGWRSVVIDPRSRFATAERFPAAERVIAEWPVKALELLPPIDTSTAVVVLTHDPKIDDQALALALPSTAFYVGAIGSRIAATSRRDRLSRANIPPGALDRLTSPCGLDIGGSSSEETALSIVAELVAVRAGRAGGRLVDAQGPIHGPAAARAGHPRSRSGPTPPHRLRSACTQAARPLHGSARRPASPQRATSGTRS